VSETAKREGSSSARYGRLAASIRGTGDGSRFELLGSERVGVDLRKWPKRTQV
jgi:hypothetical protein